MITLNKISETFKASYTDVTSGLYAPIFKVPKYNGVELDDNGNFMVELISSGRYYSKKTTIYMSVYNNNNVGYIRWGYLENEAIDVVINEEGDFYVCYVKATDDQSKCIVNLKYANCVGFIIPIEFKRFTVDGSTLTSKISPMSLIVEPVISSDTSYVKPYSDSNVRYAKIATASLNLNSTALSLNLKITEGANNYDSMLSGNVGIKISKDGSGVIKAVIKNGGGNSDFNNKFFNIVAFKDDTNTVSIYVKIVRSWTPILARLDMFDASLSGTSINLIKESELIPTPSGTLISQLF